jgi:hypothetical protein
MTNELKHYGVPGMRWGVRAASTYARYAHEKRKDAMTEKIMKKKKVDYLQARKIVKGRIAAERAIAAALVTATVAGIALSKRTKIGKEFVYMANGARLK